MEFYKILNNYTGSRLWHEYPPPSVDESVPTVLGPLFVKKNPVWKRGLDLFGSLCGLIVLSPLFLIIGILIKSVSPGPILFKQKRVGSGGRIFNCLKFRTMTLNADSTVHKEYLEKLIGSCHASEHRGVPMEKLPEDTRIIRFGHFLRASGLDELPQLINVLYGQMSLVGPRPPIPYEVQQYRHWYNGRFDVVPGLTGLWQVSGKNKLGFNEMIRLDIQYAMKRSFLLDCKILLMTPYAIFRQIREMRPTRDTMPGERSLDRR
jgi:lipopolysaccharide/colanic/teichoic acid biosynthesis glycosyltransferase